MTRDIEPPAPSDDSGWGVAYDAHAVHRLVLESDQIAARFTATTAPRRNLESTRQCVESGACWVYRDGEGSYLATVTVEHQPSFDLANAAFPSASDPWYMRRLAVSKRGRSVGGWLGPQAIHLARDVALGGGGDWLRCEVNPMLSSVVTMLSAAGFLVVPARGAPHLQRGWMAWDLRAP